jgi:hypothetical protein
MDNKKLFDAVQNAIFQKLKTDNFRKKGRTFNREVDKGLIHVINIQVGQRTFADLFTVNLGVWVDIMQRNPALINNQSFFQDYHCQIRKRLGASTPETFYWWNLKGDITKTIADVLKSIEEAKVWFSQYENKDILLPQPTPSSSWDRRFE